MRHHTLTLGLACSLALSLPAHADICFTVSGETVTENLSDTVQAGTIHLTLTDASGRVAFNDTGSLVGVITAADGFGGTTLSHRADFPRRARFVTDGDQAALAPPYVRATLEDGATPCSYWVHQDITNVVYGTRLFRNVTAAQIAADGYISQCPDENRNAFQLSGKLCIADRRKYDD